MFRTTKAKVFSAVAVPAVVGAIMIGAAGAWFHGANPVFAPEPARLNSTLSTASVGATYVTTLRATKAYFLSATTWTASSLPAGAPCSSTWGLAPGTTVYGVVLATGNYRKCSAG
jgi:hypothetical protein